MELSCKTKDVVVCIISFVILCCRAQYTQRDRPSLHTRLLRDYGTNRQNVLRNQQVLSRQLQPYETNNIRGSNFEGGLRFIPAQQELRTRPQGTYRNTPQMSRRRSNSTPRRRNTQVRRRQRPVLSEATYARVPRSSRLARSRSRNSRRQARSPPTFRRMLSRALGRGSRGNSRFRISDDMFDDDSDDLDDYPYDSVNRNRGTYNVRVADFIEDRWDDNDDRYSSDSDDSSDDDD